MHLKSSGDAKTARPKNGRARRAGKPQRGGCQRLPRKQKTQRRRALWAALPSLIPGDTAGTRDAGSGSRLGELRREEEFAGGGGADWPGVDRGGADPGALGALSAAPATASWCGADSPAKPRPTRSPVAPHLHCPQRHAPHQRLRPPLSAPSRGGQRRRPGPEPRHGRPCRPELADLSPRRRGRRGERRGCGQSRAGDPRPRPRGGQGRGPEPLAQPLQEAAGLLGPQRSWRGRRPAASGGGRPAASGGGRPDLIPGMNQAWRTREDSDCR